MAYQRKWWSGHELYGMRPQEYRFRQSFDREIPYMDLAQDDEEIQLSYWMSLYPEKIKKVQSRVEEACEALEYDSSPMYDEYPDRIFLRKICGEICERLMEEDGFEEKQELPADLYDTEASDYAWKTAVQETGRRGQPGFGPPGSRPPMPPGPRPPQPPRPQPPRDSWLRDIVDVLLFQEMHRRRCRRGNCRRRRWY